jgi:6,7-dimethyl-8-ribityllumazine synthase
VPGSFEIPGTLKLMCLSKKFDALICLGAVVKGDTDHHQYISSFATEGIGKIGLDNNLPIIFGVLTTDNIDQAFDRCGGRDSKYIATARGREKSLKNPIETGEDVGNVGFNAGLDAVNMVNIYKMISDL